MRTIVTIGKAGRVVLPKPMRDHMHLQEGTRLLVEMRDDEIAFTQEPAETTIVKKGKRRVVMGWKGFDAARAVKEARQDHLARLEGAHRA